MKCGRFFLTHGVFENTHAPDPYGPWLFLKKCYLFYFLACLKIDL